MLTLTDGKEPDGPVGILMNMDAPTNKVDAASKHFCSSINTIPNNRLTKPLEHRQKGSTNL